MELIPNYRVKYNGQFHEANIPFAIDPKDETEMSAHGVIVTGSTPPIPQAPKKKGGRPRGQSGKTKSTDGRGG